MSMMSSILIPQVTGEPVPEIRWYKDGTYVDIQRYPRFSSFSTESSVGFISITSQAVFSLSVHDIACVCVCVCDSSSLIVNSVQSEIHCTVHCVNFYPLKRLSVWRMLWRMFCGPLLTMKSNILWIVLSVKIHPLKLPLYPWPTLCCRHAGGVGAAGSQRVWSSDQGIVSRKWSST